MINKFGLQHRRILICEAKDLRGRIDRPLINLIQLMHPDINQIRAFSLIRVLSILQFYLPIKHHSEDFRLEKNALRKCLIEALKKNCCVSRRKEASLILLAE